MQFDESSSSYRCCCNLVHVRTATIILAGCELVFMLYVLVNSLIILAAVMGNGGAPPGQVFK